MLKVDADEEPEVADTLMVRPLFYLSLAGASAIDYPHAHGEKSFLFVGKLAGCRLPDADEEPEAADPLMVQFCLRLLLLDAFARA